MFKGESIHSSHHRMFKCLHCPMAPFDSLLSPVDVCHGRNRVSLLASCRTRLSSCLNRRRGTPSDRPSSAASSSLSLSRFALRGASASRTFVSSCARANGTHDDDDDDDDASSKCIMHQLRISYPIVYAEHQRL